MVVRDDHTWLLLLDREQLRAERVARGRRHWQQAVDALVVLWALPEPAADSQRALVARGHALYRELLAPLEPALRDIDRLLLQPDGALHDVAFAALVIEPGETAADARFLVERHALATALRPFAAARASTPGTDVLALGDAGGSDATAPDALRLRGAADGALPAARREAREVASAYGAGGRALVGGAARESAVRASREDTLHFAAHVVVDPWQPLDSYVQLAADDRDDGRLHGHEIAARERATRALVVLAGCASRQGAIAGGEGLLGLARAWHATGVARVIGSQWPVADASTAALMIALHRERARGTPDDVALALAQRRALADARRRSWWPWSEDRSALAGPFHWAAFTLTTREP
jgi:CHAT domain-containing protein